MLTKEFYLLIDDSVICSYLASKWIENFAELPNFRGILVKGNAPSEKILQDRKLFHSEYAGEKQLAEAALQKLIHLYSDLDETEKATIGVLGVSRYSTAEHPDTFFLGNNVNRKDTKDLLTKRRKFSPPCVFTCFTQILKPWWLEVTNSQLFNAHTAVLPYARGMYAIENMAALGDTDKFKQAAGFTIHYIDKGVDTGPIIKAERIVEPFRFNSIWELKGHIYTKEFDFFVKTAEEIISNNETAPAGVFQDPSLRGPNFSIADFTPDKRREAERGYLAMKNKAMLSGISRGSEE